MIEQVRQRLGVRRSAQPVPDDLRSNFNHLFFDIAWFGVVNGTILSFISIFLTRTGATSQQIGILGAVPAIANLIFSIPASLWIRRLPTGKAVFWASVLQRVFYVALIPLPSLLFPQAQIWTIIILTFVMSIPGTGVAVGINALIAETVPIPWRGHVMGIRNSMLSLFSVITLLIAGQILTRMAFPMNYQVLFLLGVIGAGLSSLNLFLIRTPPASRGITSKAVISTAGLREKRSHVQLEVQQKIRRANMHSRPSLNALKGHYGTILLLLFLFNFSLYLSIPVFPVFQVNVLHLTDQVISFGSSGYHVVSFFASMQIARLIRKYGNHKLTSFGIMFMMLYPLLLPWSKSAAMFVFISALVGLAWVFVNGSLVNYLLENIPSDDLAGHLAWYNLALNAAILTGSLLGPAIAGVVGLTAALIIFAFARFFSGLAILRWG
jgi:MFS family permease